MRHDRRRRPGRRLGAGPQGRPARTMPDACCPCPTVHHARRRHRRAVARRAGQRHVDAPDRRRCCRAWPASSRSRWARPRWVITVFAVAYGLSQALFGPLGDRFGKLRVITWACVASAGTALLCALAPGPPRAAGRAPAGRRHRGGGDPAGHGLDRRQRALRAAPAGAGALPDRPDHRLRQRRVGRRLHRRAPALAHAVLRRGGAVPGGRGVLVLARRRLPPPVLQPPGPARSARASPWRGSSAPCWRSPGRGWCWWWCSAKARWSTGRSPSSPRTCTSASACRCPPWAALVMGFALGGLVFAFGARVLVARLGEAWLVRGGAWLMAAALCGHRLRPGLGLGGAGLHGDGPGLLHAAQHAADQRHADGARAPRHRGGGVRLLLLPGAVGGRGPGRPGGRPARHRPGCWPRARWGCWRWRRRSTGRWGDGRHLPPAWSTRNCGTIGHLPHGRNAPATRFAARTGHFGRTHAPAPISCLRACHRLASANSVCNCAVFFASPR